MNADLSWGEVRWREHRTSPPSNESITATPHLFAAIRPHPTDHRDSQRALDTQYNRQTDHQIYAPQAHSHIPATQSMLNNFRTIPDARRSPESVSNISCGPRKSGLASPRPKSEQSRTGSISERVDCQMSSSRRASELQPALDNHGSNELPSISTTDRVSPPTQSTMLPSFSSFQRSTNYGSNSHAATAPLAKSERAACLGCVEKRSMIDDIALAVSGLDETVQSLMSGPTNNRSERPRDCSSRTAQWVLDCLKDAKVALQVSSPRAPTDYRSLRRSDHPSSLMAKSVSPSGTAKRLLNYSESEEAHFDKRQRTGSQGGYHLENAPMLAHLEEKRRVSESLQTNQPSRTYSPSLSDSWQSSVHPHQHSPATYGRSLRPLPSPSSLAATSHRASLTGVVLPPGSSPTIAHQAPPSIHNAPTSTAASHHIADLQHQVTLKSLALQTLQSEYTSLLQKFQRDRLKSQTFEKKTVAADQEVNELTTRNEELAEQVKTLETQLGESESKRETERSEAVREKDQWGKMLAMSGRLQAKNADDRQKLAQEKKDLQQRLLIQENEAAIGAIGSSRSPKQIAPLSSHECGDSAEVASKKFDDQGAAQILALQRDNQILHTRAVTLRRALERMEGHYASIMEKRRELLEQELVQIPGAIALALQEDCATTKSAKRQLGDSRNDGHDTTGRCSSISSSESAPTRSRAVNGVELPVSSPVDIDRVANARTGSQIHQPSEVAPKNATQPKLQTVPLPKWQPPGASTLRTEHLATNQRRPSGPATPYPGSEAPQWQPFEPGPARSSSPGSKSSPQPSTALPTFAKETSPARNYNPHHVPPPQIVASSAENASQQPVAAAMPPPPRPSGGLPSTTSAVASWRPSS